MPKMHNSKKFVLAAALLAFTLALTASAAAQNPHGGLTVPVSGTLGQSATSGPLSSFAGGTLSGTLNISRFANQNGHVMAVGTLVATLTDTAGHVTNLVTPVALPAVDPPAGSCNILSLTLGPLHLDLLGLVVDLNQVNLNITAQSGPGNLLGNLLCSVAGLLDGGGPVGQVVALLNQILGAL
jgi:hypothetical protein